MALHTKKIIFSSFFLLLIPSIFFGFPDYYGDDYHFVNFESKEGFYLQSLNDWINNYGIYYRPVGILINLLLYKIFSWNILIFYFCSVVAYLTLAYRAYSLSLKISNHRLDLSIFIFIFFIFFPFNSSVYYQLVSMYMVVTYIGLFYFLEKFIDNYDANVWKSFIFSFCWLILLFSYESLIGISLILPILYFFKTRSSNQIFLLKKYLYLIVTIGAPTVIFLFLYISNPLNTKINNLSETISLEKSIMSIEDAKEDKNIIEKIDSFKSNKVGDFFYKTKKSFVFFFNSIHYFFDYSKSNYFFLILYSLLILLIAINILTVQINTMTSNNASFYVLFGFLWVIGSISPFLLYPGFVIPVYHLLLPSFGLAFLIYGISNLVLGDKKFFFIRSLLLLLIVFFPIIHISYFFGLKEELSFLNILSSKVSIYSSKIKTNENIIITNVPNKKNNHIFWFENSLSKRYLKNKINYANNSKFKVKNSDSIHFIDKQTVNLIKVNFFEHPNKYQYFDFFYEKTQD